jgi:methyl-accepting chemotaxis protein WspA
MIGKQNMGVKVGLGFATVLAFIIAMGVASYRSLSSLLAEVEVLYATDTVGSTLLGDAQDAMWQLRYGVSQFIAVPSARENIIQDSPRIYSRLEAALKQYSSGKTSAEEQQIHKRFTDAYAEYKEARPKWFALYMSGDTAKAAKFREATIFQSGARSVKALGELIDVHRKLGGVRLLEAEALIAGIKQQNAVLAMLAVLTAALIAIWLNRTITVPLKKLVSVLEATGLGDFSRRLNVGRNDEFGTLMKGYNRMADELVAIVGQVQKSGVQVGSAVTEIAAGAKQQEATAVEVTATATEISATSKQIASTSKELLKTMNEVSDMAEKSAVLTIEGQTGLSRMEETMGRVMAATDSINAKLAVLNEKAGNISKVTTTITKVADQTNLLSLNAAIEAEKAGEYGRGFAVVATEIRRLADQTAVASYDIEVIVKEIQSAVSASVMGMDKFSEETRRGLEEIQQVSGQLSQVIGQVQTLTPRFETVNEGMRSQTTGAEQITSAFVQLTEAMQQATDAIRQSNVAIAEVSQIANGLSSGVSRFKLA